MNLRKIAIVFKIVRPILFLALGLFIVLNPERMGLDKWLNNLFGYFMIGYAGLRAFTVWQELKKEHVE